MNRRLSRVSLALLVVFGGAATASADIPPDPRYLDPALRSGSVPLVITIDDSLDHARLMIPQDIFDRAERAERIGSLPRTRTILAGLALSMAAGGTIFLRRKKFSPRALALLAVATVGVIGAGVALADISLPDEFDDPAPVVDAGHGNKVQVVIVDRGDDVQLALPRSMAKNFGAGERSDGGGRYQPRSSLQPVDDGLSVSERVYLETVGEAESAPEPAK